MISTLDLPNTETIFFWIVVAVSYQEQSIFRAWKKKFLCFLSADLAIEPSVYNLKQAKHDDVGV